MNLEQLKKLYSDNYVNITGAKKYVGVDDESLNNTFSLLHPDYYDFIYNVIQNKAICFSSSRDGNSYTYTYDKDTKILCSIVYSKLGDSSLFHEIGHAFDTYILGDKVYFSSESAAIDDMNDITLYDVLTEEAKFSKDSILKSILAEYQPILDAELGEDTFNKLEEDAQLVRRYMKQERKVGASHGYMYPRMSRSKKISDADIEEFKRLYELAVSSGSVARENVAGRSESNNHIKTKYFIILDVLSSMVRMDSPYRLEMHSYNYYNKNANCKFLVASEFFANMVEALVTDNQTQLSVVKKHLPRSYQAFIALFNRLKDQLM